ncbi:hypothetical protein M9434_001400 [Picochlorum sp. BPE23]|nr:hypothetical protein M9434_001400 [Picochlorum sp. BPE23]
MSSSDADVGPSGEPSTMDDLQSQAQELLQQNIAQSKKSFLETVVDAHNDVIAEFSKIWNQLVVSGPSMIQDFTEFIRAIDWSERWIQAILAVQACILLTLIIFRNNMVVQNTIFALSVVVIYKADVLNAWGARHWEDFARHNYFEKNGAFVSALISAPLLFGMLIVLVNLAMHFIQTLVLMKTEQLKKAKAKAKGKKKTQ